MKKNKVIEMRALPMIDVLSFFRQLGGEESEEGKFRGDGWKATVLQGEDVRLGALRVERFFVCLEVEEVLSDEFVTRFDAHFLRCGG